MVKMEVRLRFQTMENGNVLSSSHYYIREKEPTPQKEWIIKYDQDGKIVPSKS